VQKIPEFVRQAGRKPVEFQPYRVEDFEAAHSPAYVKGILSCTLKNGFGTLDPEINRALHYSNASLGAAVQFTLDHGGVAVQHPKDSITRITTIAMVIAPLMA